MFRHVLDAGFLYTEKAGSACSVLWIIIRDEAVFSVDGFIHADLTVAGMRTPFDAVLPVGKAAAQGTHDAAMACDKHILIRHGFDFL